MDSLNVAHVFHFHCHDFKVYDNLDQKYLKNKLKK